MRPALEDRRIVRRRFIALAKIGTRMPLLACDITFEISVTYPVEARRSGVLTGKHMGAVTAARSGLV